MPMEASGKLRRDEGGGGVLVARGGFTLTELLVVMGIMVLLLGLAAPALKIITGSRSTEAAQNLIAATLGRARNEAIGLQETRGVAIYYDATAGRTMMGVVYFPTIGSTNIDVVAEEEAMPLPVGVTVASINDDAIPRYFLVEDPNVISVVPGTGTARTPVVVLFDGNGQFVKTTYTIASGSELARRLGSAGYTYPILCNSQFGFVLCDREQFRGSDRTATWIDENTTPLVVNRYNGTLIEGK